VIDKWPGFLYTFNCGKKNRRGFLLPFNYAFEKEYMIWKKSEKIFLKSIYELTLK